MPAMQTEDTTFHMQHCICEACVMVFSQIAYVNENNTGRVVTKLVYILL